MKKLLYIFSRAPYSTADGQEGLDALLIGAAFEQSVSVLFLHDGVFQLRAEQNADSSELKIFTKAFRALQDFGIDECCVHDLSLTARGLEESELMCEVNQVTSAQICELVRHSDRVFTF